MLLVLGQRGELPATSCPGLGLNLSGEPVLLDTRRVRTSEDGILHTHTHTHGIRNGVQGAGWVANLQHADARARFLQLQDKQAVVQGELISC